MLIPLELVTYLMRRYPIVLSFLPFLGWLILINFRVHEDTFFDRLCLPPPQLPEHIHVDREDFKLAFELACELFVVLLRKITNTYAFLMLVALTCDFVNIVRA